MCRSSSDINSDTLISIIHFGLLPLARRKFQFLILIVELRNGRGMDVSCVPQETSISLVMREEISN